MKDLFHEFKPVSSKQWKQKIQYELNGADYTRDLIYNSAEDIKVRPFYHRDEYKADYSIKTQAKDFKICQNIYVQDVEKSNSRALHAIHRGTESIRFTIKDDTIDLAKLLKNIPLEKTYIYLKPCFLSVKFVEKTVLFTQKTNAQIFYNFDPIGQLAQDGNWFKTLEKNNFETLTIISKIISKDSFISINSSLYQNAGANMIQQIAYSLAHANEYFNQIKEIHQPLVFEVAVGSNYFFEIAKLRALRLLFKLIAKEYNHNLDCHILVTPSKRNKTIYDSHLNIVRTTTECMSAILGGANAIENLPFDSLFRKENESSISAARNTLLLLKKESHFDQVNNPVDGSYYIETLTHEMAEKALTLFKDIEANGGFLKKLNDGTINRKIQESATKEQEIWDSGKQKLDHTSLDSPDHPPMMDRLEIYPFVKIKPRKTLIVPIIEKRVAEKAEQERLSKEKDS